MDTIRNYLDTMFAGLEENGEVLKAKENLLQMMEDKYYELKDEGKADHEAIAVVISEFGNVEELKESLGIRSKDETEDDKYIISKDVIEDYIEMHKKSTLLVAIGVMLCICSPVMIILSTVTKNNVLGLVTLFICIGLAVGLFIVAGVTSDRFNYLKEGYHLDREAEVNLRNRTHKDTLRSTIMLAAGIILCIICVVPIFVAGDAHLPVSVGPAVLLVFVGVGVFFIIESQATLGAYDDLLKLDSKAKEMMSYKEDWMRTVMSVYWPTVTCIYLVWSFLTYDWGRTWVIWVIAWAVESLLKVLFRGEADA